MRFIFWGRKVYNGNYMAINNQMIFVSLLRKPFGDALFVARHIFVSLSSRFIPIKIGGKERGNCIFGK